MRVARYIASMFVFVSFFTKSVSLLLPYISPNIFLLGRLLFVIHINKKLGAYVCRAGPEIFLARNETFYWSPNFLN